MPATLEAPQVLLNEGMLAAYRTTLQSFPLGHAALPGLRALAFREADSLIRRIATDALALRDVWLDSWEMLEASDPSEPVVQEWGLRLKHLFGSWGNLIGDAQGGAAAMAASGLPLGSAPLLELAARQTCQLQQTLDAGWPWQENQAPPLPDLGMVQRSLAQIERGEGLTVEDAIRALEAQRHTGS